MPSPWLAGLDLNSFPGRSIGEKVAQAAHALGADILSPSAESFVSPSPDPSIAGYESFTSPEMVRESRKLGMQTKVWTVSSSLVSLAEYTADRRTQVNRLNIVEQIMEWKVDGIITDCRSSLLTDPRSSAIHPLHC